MRPHEHRTREAVIGEPARKAHLHVVDTRTGELVEHQCPECATKNDQIKGLQRTVTSQAGQITKLQTDWDEKARLHSLWPQIAEDFDTWKELTNHPRSEFTADRFWLALPFYKRKAYGRAMVQRGIRGIAWDHYTRMDKNGRMERFDGWENLFKSTGAFERYCNRAPKDGR